VSASAQVVRLDHPHGGWVALGLPMDASHAGAIMRTVGELGFEFGDRIDVLGLLVEGLHTDGESHKQWYLAEVLRRLGGTLPEGIEEGMPG
jgi:hypothetical protein